MKQDIVEDDNLLTQYGLRIPVFKCPTTHQEVDWPFSLEEIKAFIRQ